MKRVTALMLAALTAAAVPPATGHRIFSIRCVDDRGSVLYDTEIEGPAATDFTIALRDAGHEVDAAFVNEQRAGGGLDTRVHLRSRRAYGTSRSGLPLWEEDEQHHRIAVDLDQQIEMLPFGRAGDAGLLKLIITPREAPASATAQPLQIRIGRPAANGAIQVNAYLETHWFDAEVTLTRAGSIVSSGRTRIFLDETGSVALNGLGTLHLTLSAVAGQDRRQFVAFSIGGAWTGAGVAPIGSATSYTIGPDTQLTVKWSTE